MPPRPTTIALHAFLHRTRLLRRPKGVRVRERVLNNCSQRSGAGAGVGPPARLLDRMPRARAQEKSCVKTARSMFTSISIVLVLFSREWVPRRCMRRSALAPSAGPRYGLSCQLWLSLRAPMHAEAAASCATRVTDASPVTDHVTVRGTGVRTP